MDKEHQKKWDNLFEEIMQPDGITCHDVIIDD